jgi:hypothetical protein
MKNLEISRQIARIKSLVQRTQSATSSDLELQSHWAKYLCILGAGLLENALQAIFIDYVERCANPPVAHFACEELRALLNPKTQRFIETTRAFRADWAAQLEVFVETDGRKDAIDSIMALRHKIAHGKDVGVTVSRVTSYLEKSVEVLEHLEQKVLSS